MLKWYNSLKLTEMLNREDYSQEPHDESQGLAKRLAQRKFLTTGLNFSSSATGYKNAWMPP